MTNVAVALLGLALLLSCPSVFAASPLKASAEEDTSEAKKRMKLTRVQLETLNKMETDECVGDGECDELAIGESRCGGPSTHIVYSLNNPDLATIKKLGDDFTAAEKAVNSLEMSAATCGTVKGTDPKCVKNKCIDGNKKKKS